MKNFNASHLKENAIAIAVVIGFFGLIAIVSYFEWS